MRQQVYKLNEKLSKMSKSEILEYIKNIKTEKAVRPFTK